MIPIDGSTIQVIVDGVPIGGPTYNLFRPDVSGAFPGLANTNGPVGFKAIDTTGLAEGLHTISWLVVDDRPSAAGIGSRYFTVSNSADTLAPASQAVSAPTKPIGVPASPDSGLHRAVLDLARPSDASLVVQRDDGPKRRVRPARDGTHALTIAPMERLELTLGEADRSCPGTWAGYLVKDGVLGDLPVGASLDRSGTFYWQTGPGFAGRFPFLFVRTGCDAEKERVAVAVTVSVAR
jgi:hypothetical protein